MNINKKICLNSLLIILFVGFIPYPLFGKESTKDNPEAEESSKDKREKVPIYETVITAQRKETLKLRVPRSIETLKKDKIKEIQPSSLPETLKESTGIMVQITNRGAGAPIIRGMIGPKNLIVVDGIRFNNSIFRTGPNQYLALFDPWSLKSIEIVRGPGSVLYGNDAIGGVIHLITLDVPKPKKKIWDLRLGSRFKSADLSYAVMANGDIRTKNLGALAGGSINIFNQLRTGGGKKELQSDFERGSGYLKAEYQTTKNSSLTFSFLSTVIQDAKRIDRIGQGKMRIYDNESHLWYLKWKYKGQDIIQRIEANLSFHLTRDLIKKFRCETEEGIVRDLLGCAKRKRGELLKIKHNQDNVYTPGGFIILEPHFLEHKFRLVLGTEFYWDYVTSSAKVAKPTDWEFETQKRGNFSSGSTYLLGGAFLYSDIDLIEFNSSLFVLGLGGRTSMVKAYAPDVPPLGDVDYSYRGSVVSASLAYIYRDNLNLYLDYSQGFRAPNLQESTVLGDTGNQFEVPNPDLKPERADTIEIGTKVDIDFLRLELASFFTWISDAFIREDVPRQEWEKMGISPEDVGELDVVRRVNGLGQFYKGIESGLGINLFSGFKLWANLAWILGDTKTQEKTQPSRRVPPLLGNGGVRYEIPKGYVEVFTRWAQRQDRLHEKDRKDLRICEDPKKKGTLLEDCKGTPGWITLNLRAGYRFKYVYLDITLENITDTRYKYHGSGIYAPGFNAIGSLEIKF
jgi:outer membrane receptor protein involved in Fe transport